MRMFSARWQRQHEGSGFALRTLSQGAVHVQVPYTQAERSYYLFSRWIQLVRSDDSLFFEALVGDEQ